jgi:signal transduction histidine kinase
MTNVASLPDDAAQHEYAGVSICAESERRRTKNRPVSLSRQRSRDFGQVSAQRNRLIVLVDSLTEEREVTKAVVTERQQLAIADERERIARDLHDTVIQRLFGAGIGLQSAIGRGYGETEAAMDRVIEEIDVAIRDIRSSIFHLRRPTRLIAVSEALGATLDEFRRILPGTLVATVDGNLNAFVSAELGGELLALVRESLMNVVKHAHATIVNVEIVVDGSDLSVRVLDDGIGFDASVITVGLGLRNLRDRASSLGGWCTMSARSGGGTEVVVRLPLTSLSVSAV